MTQLGRIIAPGRTSDVYEYGRGSVVKVPRPGVPPAWAAIEAEIQLAIHCADPPSSLIEFADRVRAKVDAAHVLSAGERNEAQRILASLPRGSSLCHGDLHPGNVLADLEVAPGVARCWEAVLAASRLSEHAEADGSGLLALWRGRSREAASPLLDAISALR